MPRRDPGSVWNLLADLWRELSWTMRSCGTAGMIGGLVIGLWLTSHIPPGEARYGFVKLLWWLTVGLTVVGATLGLAVGALIEWLRSEPPRTTRRR